VLGFETMEDYLDHSLFSAPWSAARQPHPRRPVSAIDGERFEVESGRRACASWRPSVCTTRVAGRRSRGRLHHSCWRSAIRIATMVFPAISTSPAPIGCGAPATLVIELEARTDRPTLCNLAHHSYFNLDDGGRGDILDHRLMIAASAYLPIDDEMLPTGHVVPVEGTAFDFVLPRPIRLEWEAETLAYDHNFCLAAQRGPLRQAAWVQGGRAGVEMEVWTTEPGLQFFDGNFPPREVPGLGGRQLRRARRLLPGTADLARFAQPPAFSAGRAAARGESIGRSPNTASAARRSG
jgi:aldose 1-epimerase